MKKIYYSIILCLLLASPTMLAHAQQKVVKQNIWQKQLSAYLAEARKEYNHYLRVYDDGSLFPQAREQEFLSHIETKFLKNKIYATTYQNDNPLAYVSSLPMAKLFLYYGGNPFDRIAKRPGRIYVDRDATPLLKIAQRKLPYNNATRSFYLEYTHDKVIEKVKYTNPAGLTLPSNNSIDLFKAYLALGADINATAGILNETILEISLYIYSNDAIETARRRPDEKHRADDIIAPYIAEKYYDDGRRTEASDGYAYRSPVTYWIEEFIEAGYPASMLDTHKLHYPRFMKDASVAEVMDMLNNPDAHKIPANINCPYQRKQGAGDEVAQAVSPAELCPLTPSVNMRDAMGRTPLHIAGEQGNKAVFNALIQIGADASVKDFRGNVARY